MNVRGNRAGIIILDGNKTLLMHRTKPNIDYYCILGGHLDEGETPEQAAVRELKEETCLEVTLGPVFMKLNNQGRKETYFLAQSWTGTAQLGGEELEGNSPDNHYELEWVEIDKLKTITLYPSPLHNNLILYLEDRLQGTKATNN